MLTDALKKSKTSNIGKIIILAQSQLEDVTDTLNLIEEWTDLDKAQGAVLDEIGADINQYRGQANDAIYRMMIRSKRARAASDGSYNAIIDTMAKTLNCKPTDLKFRSVIEQGGTEPLALVVERIPIDVVSNAGLTQSQLVALIEQVTPGDVRVASANFEGTFRFSSFSEIETSEYGFSSDGTDGGTLSVIFMPSNDTILPI